MSILDLRLTKTISAITAKKISLRYGNKYAFKDISLNMVQDKVTAIVGPSGCGKSSFLQALNRLTDNIENCHLEGEILFHGTDILGSSISTTILRRRIGMIFQKPNPFPFTIYKNLSLGLKEIGVKDKKIISAKIKSVLQEVGLWNEVKDRLQSSATLLSGGQQQRLCIARALILEPEILLMDEPCSALDPISTKVIEKLILKLKGRYTIVIVTHNLAQAKRIADTVTLFWVKNDSGTLIETADSKQFFEAPQSLLARSYIEGTQG